MFTQLKRLVAVAQYHLVPTQGTPVFTKPQGRTQGPVAKLQALAFQPFLLAAQGKKL